MEKNSLEKNTNFVRVRNFILSAEGRRRKKVEECTRIQDLYSEQFSLERHGGKKMLNGFLLFQCLWKTATKMKIPDFTICHKSLDEKTLFDVNLAINSIVRDSCLVNAFTDKTAVFFRSLLFGDAFVRIGASYDSPIKFETCSIQDIWIDSNALEMRSSGGNIDVDELAISYYYSKSEFDSLYPNFSNKVIAGKVPFFDGSDEGDFVQVVHYYSRSRREYIVLAGSNAVSVFSVCGDDYPYYDLHNKPYIPVLHFACFPSLDGFYNSGLGNLLYNLHIETRRLMNMAISAISNRVDPLYTITMKKSKIAEFQNWFYKALEAKSRGEMGIIPVDTDENGNAEYGRVQSIIGEELSNEFERLLAQYDQIVKRLGINLDDISYSGDTARHTILREENSSNFVRQIIEQNSSEFRFAIECILSAIRDFVAHDDNSRIASMTMGELSQILADDGFYVDVDLRSGAYLNNAFEIAKIDEVLKHLPRESKAYSKVISERSKLLGVEIQEDDLNVK